MSTVPTPTSPSRGILRQSHSFPGTLADRSNHPAGISFAPLPSIDTKRSKKLRTRPLGVAGRSSILRNQKRLHNAHNYNYIDPDDHYPDDQDSAYPRSRSRHDQMSEDDLALLELGRMIKDAGKRLWRAFSQSRSHLHADAPPSTDDPGAPPLPFLPTSEKDKDAGRTIREQGEEILLNEVLEKDAPYQVTTSPPGDIPISDHDDSGYHETFAPNHEDQMQSQNRSSSSGPTTTSITPSAS